jgi:hypothetical protein
VTDGRAALRTPCDQGRDAEVVRFAQTAKPDRRKVYQRGCNFEWMDMMVQERIETQLPDGVGSQGTAALGIMMNLLLALRSKGALRDVEVLAILDTAAETAEKSTDEIGRQFAKLVAGHIRQMIDPFANPDTLGRLQ